MARLSTTLSFGGLAVFDAMVRHYRRHGSIAEAAKSKGVGLTTAKAFFGAIPGTGQVEKHRKWFHLGYREQLLATIYPSRRTP